MKITQRIRFWSLLFLIGILFCVSHVSADIIEPGKKSIQVYYKVTNIDSCPDYVFLVYTFSPMISYSEIKANEEITGYKFSNANIYAMKASEYENLIIGEDYESIKQFFEQNDHLIQSNVELTFSGKQVPEIDPLVSQTILLEIDILTRTSLKIHLSSIHYTYSDGTIEEVTYRTDDRTPDIIYPSDLPEPLSRNAVWLWYTVIPSCAVLGIAIVIRIVHQKDGM